MKRIAKTLSVSRSNLYERQKRDSKFCGRGGYHKVQEEGLLPMIRGIVDERPTYGYPRTAAMLNRRFGHWERPG